MLSMETTISHNTARLVSRINVFCPHTSLLNKVRRFWVTKHLSFDEGPEERLLGIKGPWISREHGEGRETAQGQDDLAGQASILPGPVLIRTVSLCALCLRKSIYGSRFVIF